MSDECVRVVVRCRPLNSEEKRDKRKICANVDTELREICLSHIDNPDKTKTFTFDNVYGSETEQRRVYDETALPLVDSVLGGYNGTIFAYGQTGTGKTFTMEGVMDPPELRGIIPNAFDHIFSTIGACTNKRFLVRASMLEIYNEDVHDLINDDKRLLPRLDIRENPETGPYVEGLQEQTVTSADDLMSLLQKGTNNRTTAATNMNKASSRSHSIFTIRIESSQECEDGTQKIKVAKLNLVDLAGSERQSKTKATGQRLLEAAKINKSLLTLGYVIKALVEGSAKHVPYRDSKLTRLLQDSLGGNAKTIMIATVGPADWNYDESLATLRYANSAKSIKNKPKINEDPKDSKIRDLQAELERLRRQLEEQQLQPVSASRDFGEGIVSKEDGEDIELTANRQKEAEDQAVEFQNRLKELEVELKSQNETEKVALLEEKQKLETFLSERQAAVEEYEAQLRAKEESLRQQQLEREQMADQIKAMEEKLLIGGALEDKAKQQEIEMRRLEAENEERRRQEDELARELRSKEEEHKLFEQKYASVTEEIEMKTRFIQKLRAKVKTFESEIADLETEFQNERMDLVDQIRDLNQELLLKSAIIDSFIPEIVCDFIQRNAVYDDENDTWILPHSKFAGNPQRASRPLSFDDLHLDPSTKVDDKVPLQLPERITKRFARTDSDNSLSIEHPALMNSFFGVDNINAVTISRKDSLRNKSARPMSNLPSSSRSRPPTESSRAIPRSKKNVREVRYA
ncbi:hypothetical protein GEMRC1_009204 [Eukaryota sp. GEM-RC1]